MDRNNTSTNGNKQISKKKQKALEDLIYTTNPYVEDKAISEGSVRRQLEKAPGPDEKTVSSYPHRYLDKTSIFYPKGKLEDRARIRAVSPVSEWSNSSTTSLREFPVTQDDKPYDYNKKPAENPGPFRAITNQNKKYKGTIAHDGAKDAVRPANGGGFHQCR